MAQYQPDDYEYAADDYEMADYDEDLEDEYGNRGRGDADSESDDDYEAVVGCTPGVIVAATRIDPGSPID